MTCWPSCCVSCAANTRATWSTDPPGGKTAISLMGLAGQAPCAKAAGAARSSVITRHAKRVAINRTSSSWGFFLEGLAAAVGGEGSQLTTLADFHRAVLQFRDL